MFNARVNVRHLDGSVERRTLTTEDEYRGVLRNEFGLDMTDDEITACLAIVEQRGTRGPPRPFFA